MSKIINSFLLLASFNFRYCPNEKQTVIYVNEYKCSYHVSVRRFGWELPVVTGLIIYKKYRTDKDFCTFDFIENSVKRFLAVNHYLKENV